MFSVCVRMRIEGQRKESDTVRRRRNSAAAQVGVMDADVQTFHQDFTAMQRSLDAAAVTQREMTAKARTGELRCPGPSRR